MVASQKTLATRSRHQLERATRVQRDIPITNAGKLELTVGMGDLRAMAISEIRSRLIEARDTAAGMIKTLLARHAALAEQLEAAGGQAALAVATAPEVEALRAALALWIARPVAVLFERCGASGEHYYREKADLSPEIDIAEKTITGNIRFQLAAQPNDRPSIVDELDREKTIPFSPVMLELAEQLAAAKTAAEQRQTDLNSINRQIAELAHKGDAIQTALTKAHLRGELTDSSKILDVIADNVNLLALPPAVSAAMRALPGPQTEQE